MDGPGLRKGSIQVLDTLGVPRDPRGIVLLCGFVASAAFGLGTLLTAGDPIGWAYILVAAVGYLFLQTRLVPTSMWLLIAAGGAAIALSGNSSGWIECALGLSLAGVALTRVPLQFRDQPARPSAADVPPRPLLAIGGVETSIIQSSAKAEVSQDRTSASAEVSPATPGQSNGSVHLTALPVAPIKSASAIRVKAIGRLQLEAGSVDVGRRLEPRLQFLFSYLLARRIAGMGPADRTGLAEEVAPGIGLQSQRDRLRKQLYELQNLDASLASLVSVDKAGVSLSLDGVACDAADLIAMAGINGGNHNLIDAKTAEQVRLQLEAAGGELLPGFEELEQQITQARGTASEVVASARQAVAQARADLALALAQHYLAVDHAERAIVHLVRALEGCPQRQDLARVLVAAYLQTGQTARARDARREYDLIEES